MLIIVNNFRWRGKWIQKNLALMRHGSPIAKLVPASAKRHELPASVAEALRRLRKGKRLKGLSVRTLIETGRR